MNGFVTIQGKVIGSNSIQYEERIIECWTNSMQAAVVPQPLDLTPYEGKVIEVGGRLHGNLWEARFEGVIHEEGYQEITGKVLGFNIIEGHDGPVGCYRHGIVEAWYLPLNLSEYLGRIITVAGELHGRSLYRATIIGVPEITVDRDPAKEAKSLNDLLIIRAASRDRIEAVNRNLGTALGFKWTNGQRTDHSCVIIFVPQKTLPWLVPDEEKAPEVLEAPDGKWCFTDVVTGGKAESLEDIGSLSELSEENKEVVRELKSGRIGLIGGIQLAFFSDGIEDDQHSAVGTAGIAVLHRETNRIGFLTNQHVADAPGRRIFHPWHNYFHIGRSYSIKEYEADQDWYNGVIDEAQSYVRCDCGFVEMEERLESNVESGLYAIGKTGELLKIEPETMDIIGQKVISIGRTRGVQRGRIVAYAYEFKDEYYSIYTDLLIIGEDGKAFSWKGDSGKIIVTDDDAHRPIALLWGGWQERLRHGREQENWTYAIDLGKVLDRLNLELFE
ncbi:MAG: hypothetical protein KAU41_07560 [Deltaproteobacteria bacterium]|jgi:hypothetical protein|nr:hypothetical protein [Deltaproteobacteria bacterium]